MGALWQDVRFGLRMLAKNPGFTAVAVLTLALGIGANAALFSVIDSVVFRTLPVARVAELVDVGSTATKNFTAGPSISWPLYLEYRDQASSPFTGLAAYIDRLQVTLAPEGGTGAPATAAVVTGNYFELLGVGAARGRMIERDDDVAGDGNDVVVLNNRYWKREFGARADAVGAKLRINGTPYLIIGVTPKDFFGIGLNRIPDVWLPMSSATRVEPIYRTQMQLPGNPYFRVVGRMKPGVTIEQAGAEMQVAAAQLGAGKTTTYVYPFTAAGGRKVSDPFEKPWPLLAPVAALAGERWKELSAVLGGVIVLVLLIVASDLASLLLARAERRQREIAIRLALGASRIQIIRALLVEGLLLSGFGAAAGLVLGGWSVKLLVATGPPDLGLPLGAAASILDWRVLIFTLSIAAATGIAFSLAPAMRAARADVLTALKSDSRGAASGKPRATLRGGLIVFQIAASVLLLSGAGLLLRTLWSASHIQLEFPPEHVLVAGMNLAKQGYGPDAAKAFPDKMHDAITAVPGARAVAFGTVPGLGVGATPQRAGDFVFNTISPGYFATLNLPLLRGREFTAQDREGAPFVAIVNQTMAREFWPGQEAVGQRLPHISPMLDATVEIVGVVPDTRKPGMGGPMTAGLYVPIVQFYSAYPWPIAPSLLVRSDGDARALLPGVVAAVARLDRNLVLLQPQTIAQRNAATFSEQRFIGWLLVIFAALAVVLAATGLYGLISYTTAARTREIGVRMALGAERRDVLRLILRGGFALAVAGVAVGVGAAVALTRYIASLLYGVRAIDPVTFVGVAVLLLGVALIASYVPARRAAKLDPMVALRYE
jgi:putative ABC transport system permease protein